MADEDARFAHVQEHLGALTADMLKLGEGQSSIERMVLDLFRMVQVLEMQNVVADLMILAVSFGLANNPKMDAVLNVAEALEGAKVRFNHDLMRIERQQRSYVDRWEDMRLRGAAFWSEMQDMTKVAGLHLGEPKR